jgi:hypothetical protein
MLKSLAKNNPVFKFYDMGYAYDLRLKLVLIKEMRCLLKLR